jgi:hypothetical protein
MLGYAYDMSKEFFGLPSKVYHEGLSEDEDKRILQILTPKRVPYIQYPNICGKCGELWPEFFFLPDEEWQKYVQINARELILCRRCYKQIKNWIDSEKRKQETR